MKKSEIYLLSIKLNKTHEILNNYPGNEHLINV